MGKSVEGGIIDKLHLKIVGVKRLKPVISVLGIAAGILVVAILSVPLPNFSNDFSTAVLDRRGQVLRVFLAGDQSWRLPVDSIPNKYRRALLLYEDRRYYFHPGVDALSLAHAFFQCVEARGYVRGASTIPMQIARITNPKARTPLNKLYEMLQALKMSLFYSKKQLLNLYATYAPMGGNTVGMEAACFRWFGKDKSMLSWAEVSLLAVLPNSPSLIRSAEGLSELREKRNRLLAILFDHKLLDKLEYEESLDEPLPNFSRPMPFEAPHAARWLREHSNKPVIRATIDRLIQHNTSTTLANYLDRLGRVGISNAAIVVAETSTGEVRAYCGSQDFFSGESRGQVDGVQAPRSTGSVLKPFLYGALFDRGDILPRSMIPDVPVYFGTFVPSNADNRFHGVVSAGEALLRSLNVPAVMMLSEYGIGNFKTLLERGGMTTLFRSADEYGLPLILGGAEGTLWEISGLYRMLGRGGLKSPLKLIDGSGDEGEQSERVLSEGACWQVLDILKDLNRPGNEYYWRLFENQHPIAWKTGTSYGQRDAWAVGVTPRWTIGVWVGNFNGVGNPELGGARTAGPLLFEVLSLLPDEGAESWFACPEHDLKMVDICTRSGYHASPRCPETETVFAPKKSEQTDQCPYHQVLHVDKRLKYQVCSLCWGSDGAVADTLLLYPPDVVDCLRKLGKHADELLPHLPTCPTQAGQNPISIVYPSSRTGLWIPRGISGEKERVILRAAHSNGDAHLYWYVDGRYLGITHEIHQRAVLLNSGKHQLTLVDGEGHRRQVDFVVGQRH